MDEEYEDEGSELEQLIEQQEQELAMAEQQKQLEVEERLLRNKLRAIFRNISFGRTSLKELEKRTIKRAKKFPSLKKEINRINGLLVANKAKRASKIMSSSPIFMYVLFGALFVFFIIAVIAAVGSVFSWLFPDEDDGLGGGGTANSVLGITGNDFYGARMVYTNNEKATQSIVEDYVQFVENAILKAEQITTISAGGSEYSVNLEINHITLPSDDFDYSTLSDVDFKDDYEVLYQIILEMAKVTYLSDNGSNYEGLNLIECVDGIKYFGFGDVETIATNVAEEIVDLSSISAKDSGGSAVTLSTTLNLIEDAIEQKLVEHFTTNTIYSVRTEKLFVKDYILEDDEATISGVTQENYVAMIFMPKKNVTFTGFSFAVGNADLTNFSINMDGLTIGTDGNNLGSEEKQSYIYSASGIVLLSAETFTDIDENNLTALADGLSLFDIVENSELNNDYYLTDSNGVLNLKRNGVVVELQNDEAFNFVEFETGWQTAS